MKVTFATISCNDLTFSIEVSSLSLEKITMKPKKVTKVVHTKNTRDTKNTNNGLVYASGGRATKI